MLHKALIGALRLAASRREAGSLNPSSINSVLVVELTRLGDVIATLPTLARLREVFGKARLSVLLDVRYASLLRAFDIECEVIGVDAPGRAVGLLNAMLLARKTGADLAISMSPPRRNASTVLASGAQRMLGYLSYVDSLTPFLTSTPVEAFGMSLGASLSYERENMYHRAVKVLLSIGVPDEELPRSVSLRPEVVEATRAGMLKSGKIPGGRYVMMHPFSGWKFRNWPLPRFVALAERISCDLSVDVVVSAEGLESATVEQLLKPSPRLRVFASSDLVEMAVLMQGSSLVIGNDSGPLHLAAMLGARVVGLFGPAPPELTAPPAHQRSSLVYHKVECSPCDQRVCVRPDQSCMTFLSSEMVFSAVSNALQQEAVGESASTNV